jgi:tetratricopeptide (TPR) repeat protein
MLALFLLISALSPELDSLLFRAIDCSYAEDFSHAESLITIVKKKEIDHPAPYFLLSSLYEMMWVDMGENSYKENIFIYADSAIDKGKKWTKENPQDPWGYFFIGGSHTIKIFYYVVREDYFGTIFLINPAIYYLEKARDIDSNLADIYLGLGGWEYMKGHLPFMGKDKEKGLAMIRKAISGARYVSLYSSLAYANICIKEKDYDEALPLLVNLLDSFPDSRTFTWPLLKAYYEKKDYKEALNTVERLILISAENNFSNFEAHYYKAKILFNLGMLKEASLTADETLNINVREDMLHVKDIKKDLIRLKEEVKKKLEEA